MTRVNHTSIPRAICAILLLLHTCLSAAPSLTASLDRDVVPIGETVTLTLVFQDANPRATPTFPPIPGITVGGVSQGSEFTVVNGQTSSKLSFSYTLVPSQLGDIVIPAMRVRVDGSDLTTPLLKLNVVKNDAAAAPDVANKTAFLKLVIPRTNLVVGEALPVDVNLYVLEGREAHLPQIETAGFTVGKIQQQGQTRTRVGNQLFTLVTFKTYVSPVRSGSLPLGPATMQLSIPRPNARRTIFGDIVDWQPVTLSTDTPSSIAINVRKRALSRTPAIPTTRFLGNPETQNAACAIASSGLVTTIMMQFGEYFTTPSVAVLMTA